MIRVVLEVSAASTPGADPVLEIASWLALALREEPIEGMIIHGMNVEVDDA